MRGWTAPVIVVGLVAGAATASRWVDALFGVFGSALLLIMAPVSPRVLAFRMRPFAYFAVVTLLLGGLGPGRTLVAVGPFHWGAESVEAAGIATVRLLLLGIIFSWMSLRVGVARIVAALWHAGRRMKRHGLNLDSLLLAFAVAVRFLPLLQDEAARLKMAWEARGGNLAAQGIVGRVKSAAGLLVPLFAAALRRAEDFANAVEIRTRGGGLESAPARVATEDAEGGTSWEERRLIPEGRWRAPTCVLAAWSGVIAKVWHWL